MAAEKNDSEMFDLAAPVVVRGDDFNNPGENDTGIPASGPRGPVARWKGSDQDHTQSRTKKP